MIAQLTSSSHSPSNSFRMPSSDTTDFSVTSMGFLLQVPDSESFHDTGHSFTFGDTENIEILVLLEDGINADFLFEKGLGEFDFVCDGSKKKC